MAVHNAPFVVGTARNAVDCAPALALVAATTNRTLSIKSLTISVTAAATVTIEDSDGTDVIVFNALPAGGGVARDWDPGEVPVTISKGASVLSSTSDVITCIATFWYKDA